MSSLPAPVKRRKLNDRVVERLVEMYCLGASQGDACRYAGISPDALQQWIKAGRAQLAALAAMPPGEYETPDEAALVLALDRAQGEFARANLANIKTAAELQWQASAWLLERRFPEEYGRRDRVEVRHTIDEAVERLIRERGLDGERAAKLRDFAAERARRRAS